MTSQVSPQLSFVACSWLCLCPCQKRAVRRIAIFVLIESSEIQLLITALFIYILLCYMSLFSPFGTIPSLYVNQ